ncbi:MAG: C25 family cysteine peptidase, partial [Candidatus Sumerlaeota bacterium]|nr:C25 family cysteine peptidase [Candidatus Sumerlaeota bacterium]
IWFGGDSPNSDNLLLLNGPLLPFVANFTCDTGSIDYPKPSWNVCIAEDMMRAPNGGARGLYVPSGPGQTYEHQQLAAELSQALFHDRMERQGDAMALLSARFLTRHPSERDSNDQRLFRYIQMYELLGDPTTPFPQPRGACRLSVDPPAVEAGRVSVRASIAEAPFDAGKAVFRLEDPDGKSFGGETDEQRFDAQTGSFTLRLPPRPTPGLWTVKAYLWNDERRVDAAGAVEFPLDSRCAEIRDFHIEPGAPPRLSLRVANDSLLPIDALRFEIRETEGSKIAVIAADSLRLQPKEEKTWEKDWPTSFGLHPLSARLIDPGRSLRPEQTLATRKEIVWANPDPNGPLRFALSNNALTRAFRRLGSVAELEVQATAYLASGWFAGAVEVGAGLSGDVETSTTVRFAGGQASSSAPAILVLRAPAADLPKPFFVEVDPGRKIPGRDPARVRAFSSIDFSLLPDLAFDVSRGGGVAIDPEKPSDGHTIFFRVPIENKGAGPAGEFQVAAYDGDPTSGTRELANRAGPTYWSIPGLAAGARTEALLRWDPDKNAGDHKIYFKIDTLNHVLESNKNNNLSRVLLHVRTLARLETPRLEVDASGWARRQLRINASVHNAGESEARNVVFAFFGSLEPTPASKLGEILVHHVSPGETHAESYVWDVPPSFIAEGRKQDFSAQIYLKGSLQRISVFRSSYFPKSTPGR